MLIIEVNATDFVGFGIFKMKKPVFGAAQLGGNLFSVERSETKQVSSYDLLSQTGFGSQARNQFSHSLTLMAEIGWLRENLFSGFQTGFGLGVRNQFSHSLVLAAEIGFWRLSYAQS